MLFLRMIVAIVALVLGAVIAELGAIVVGREVVVAAATFDVVFALAAVQVVFAVATVELVVAQSAGELVVARAAKQLVVAVGAKEVVLAAAAVQRVFAVAAVHVVVTRPAMQDIAPGAALHGDVEHDRAFILDDVHLVLAAQAVHRHAAGDVGQRKRRCFAVHDHIEL